MRYEIYDCRNKNSNDNVNLKLYLLDFSPEIKIKTRPIVIICPGGGYAFTSDREAEIIAMQFLSMGYHAAVLRYSVAPAVFPTAFLELAKSVIYIREKADDFYINPDQIILCGFSAGGHLAASYSVFWNRNDLAGQAGADNIDILKPNALILGYPVITSGEFAHDDSFRNLLAGEYETKKSDVSLECFVGRQVPRCFIWHTYEDRLVPVQNSMLFVDQLIKNNIPVEFHLFEKGGHGLALANRLTVTPQGNEIEPAAAQWINLVHVWIEGFINGQEG